MKWRIRKSLGLCELPHRKNKNRDENEKEQVGQRATMREVARGYSRLEAAIPLHNGQGPDLRFRTHVTTLAADRVGVVADRVTVLKAPSRSGVAAP